VSTLKCGCIKTGVKVDVTECPRHWVSGGCPKIYSERLNNFATGAQILAEGYTKKVKITYN
jgi:hypothetical protein